MRVGSPCEFPRAHVDLLGLTDSPPLDGGVSGSERPRWPFKRRSPVELPVGPLVFVVHQLADGFRKLRAMLRRALQFLVQ